MGELRIRRYAILAMAGGADVRGDFGAILHVGMMEPVDNLRSPGDHGDGLCLGFAARLSRGGRPRLQAERPADRGKGAKASRLALDDWKDNEREQRRDDHE